MFSRKTIYLYGGIERAIKENFLITLSSEFGEEERKNVATLIPLITGNLGQGSIIFSDS